MNWNIFESEDRHKSILMADKLIREFKQKDSKGWRKNRNLFDLEVLDK